MTRLELQPAHELWQLYQPEDARFAFQANTIIEAQAWQTETRKALSKTLGFQEFTSPIVIEVIEKIDKGSYTREKILLRTADHSVMPVYLLIPKNVSEPIPSEPIQSEPIPCVLAIHGHGYGVKDIVGIWEDGTDRDNPDGIYKDFAVELCKQGFAVVAPELACFGERQSDFSYLKIGQSAPSSCMHAAMLASHLGGSIAGIRVRDCRRLIDYLETRSEFDISRLGAMGLSGGGMIAFFTACLDERIKASVISGYYSTFRDSILALNHCACNFIHGLHEFGEMSDLAALIAPRALFIEAGSHDHIFPIEAVEQSVEKTKDIYECFKVSHLFDAEYFEGRHCIHGNKAYSFLKSILLER